MRPGRKLKEPPFNAADLIEGLAAKGWSIVGIAKRLGTTPQILRRWQEENPDLDEAMQNGREDERWQLHNALFKQAVEKNNSSAAMFLLKAKHGYVDNNRVEVESKTPIISLSDLAKLLPT